MIPTVFCAYGHVLSLLKAQHNQETEWGLSDSNSMGMTYSLGFVFSVSLLQ